MAASTVEKIEKYLAKVDGEVAFGDLLALVGKTAPTVAGAIKRSPHIKKVRRGFYRLSQPVPGPGDTATDVAEQEPAAVAENAEQPVAEETSARPAKRRGRKPKRRSAKPVKAAATVPTSNGDDISTIHRHLEIVKVASSLLSLVSGDAKRANRAIEIAAKLEQC